MQWVKGWSPWSVVLVVALIGYGVYRLTDDSRETGSIEREIRSSLAEQLEVEPVELTLTCPETVEWEPNEDFHCSAEDASGQAVRVTVHMENGDGAYTWAVE